MNHTESKEKEIVKAIDQLINQLNPGVLRNETVGPTSWNSYTNSYGRIHTITAISEDGIVVNVDTDNFTGAKHRTISTLDNSSPVFEQTPQRVHYCPGVWENLITYE